MRIGLFFKYVREVVNRSENGEIPDLWGRVDRYASGYFHSIPCKISTSMMALGRADEIFLTKYDLS